MLEVLFAMRLVVPSSQEPAGRVGGTCLPCEGDGGGAVWVRGACGGPFAGTPPGITRTGQQAATTRWTPLDGLLFKTVFCDIFAAAGGVVSTYNVTCFTAFDKNSNVVFEKRKKNQHC